MEFQLLAVDAFHPYRDPKKDGNRLVARGEERKHLWIGPRTVRSEILLGFP